jgi:hypothetical protein
MGRLTERRLQAICTFYTNPQVYVKFGRSPTGEPDRYTVDGQQKVALASGFTNDRRPGPRHRAVINDSDFFSAERAARWPLVRFPAVRGSRYVEPDRATDGALKGSCAAPILRSFFVGARPAILASLLSL